MLEDVLTPAQRKVAYVVWKWLSFGVALASTVVAGVNARDPEVLLYVALANSVVLFLGTAIGKQAEDNTPAEV